MEAGRILRRVEQTRNESTIRYTNLAPGKYVLRVRAISNEDQRVMLEERSIDIIIAQPFWLTPWAMILYAILISLIAVIILRVLILKKQRKVSDEKYTSSSIRHTIYAPR